MPWHRTRCCDRIIISLALLFTMLLVGCSNLTTGSQAPDSFIPPTSEATDSSLLLMPPTPTPARLQRTPKPTPTPICTDILGFLEDLSIPDGTVFRPGERMDKRWRVVNNGTCNWDERYRLKLISGIPLGVESEQALVPARSGTEATIQLIFTAPEEPGTYRSAWQAYDPEGIAFGDHFFVEIIVEAQTP
jgi:hypothetical protein